MHGLHRILVDNLVGYLCLVADTHVFSRVILVNVLLVRARSKQSVIVVQRSKCVDVLTLYGRVRKNVVRLFHVDVIIAKRRVILRLVRLAPRSH